MLSDASNYSEHCSLQIHDTQLFIPSIIRKMDWLHEDQEVMMDIGCGPGNALRSLLLPSFSRVKKAIAVDVLPDMIEFAKKNNAHEKIEYHTADIEDRISVEKWSQEISKVVSIYCFHWLKKQEVGFRNIYHLLKPGGEAALLFALSSPFWDSLSDHIEHPKWHKYLKNIDCPAPESHCKKYGSSHYKKLLEDIGFDVIICECESRTFVYPSDDDCRAASYSICALTKYIPDELKEEFKEVVFQGMLKYNGRSSDGRPMLRHTTLSLLIRKPKA